MVTILPEGKNSAEWLRTLLHSSFGHCDDHQHLRYNEKNVFCIDCKLSLCRHCKEAHTLHRRIQIYKYVYQDVVRHSELQKYFDCSRIQTYISNNEKIIHLNPRRSLKSPKPSRRDNTSVDVGTPESQSQDTKVSSKLKSGGTCEECGKHLQDERNCFCSISCKISVLSAEPKLIKSPKSEVSDHSLNDNQNSETESSISEAEPYERAEVVIPRKRPRKAIPHRSPFVSNS
ncbi:protein RGF1 INDUCIBLE TRANSCRIPTION FACTOR 1-like [Prosopis cineraria]|uniref:protein RGF1 INDUCIBLE TRANSCRIPTION FACTOR 1-like n=1 Tax=Prosopis cineraria TaxID=364024 RepID=UPI00240F1E68|nr:protein RGF1 INDUCIBLE TRANSCRIPTION FACTOR 1-like [Prosopis cineraria]